MHVDYNQTQCGKEAEYSKWRNAVFVLITCSDVESLRVGLSISHRGGTQNSSTLYNGVGVVQHTLVVQSDRIRIGVHLVDVCIFDSSCLHSQPFPNFPFKPHEHKVAHGMLALFQLMLMCCCLSTCAAMTSSYLSKTHHSCACVR